MKQLGRLVGGCAVRVDVVVGHERRIRVVLAEAEVAEADGPGGRRGRGRGPGRDHDVVEFDVSVGDVVLVHEGECFEDLADDGACVGLGDGAARPLHVLFEVEGEELHHDHEVGALHEPAVAAGEEVGARGLGEEQEEAQLVLDFAGSGGGGVAEAGDLLLHGAGGRVVGAGVEEVLAEDEAGAASADPLVATPDLAQRGVCDEHLVVGGGGDGGGELRVREEYAATQVGVETRKGIGDLGGLIGTRIIGVALEVCRADVLRMRKGRKGHVCGVLSLKDDGLSEAMFNDS